MIAIDACVLPVASAWLRTKARLVPSYRIYVYTIHVIRTRSTHVTPDRKTGYYDSNRWVERIKLVENNLSEIISISLLSPSNCIRSIENSSFRFFYLRSILTDRPTDRGVTKRRSDGNTDGDDTRSQQVNTPAKRKKEKRKESTYRRESARERSLGFSPRRREGVG